MSEFEFSPIFDTLKVNPEIEGKTGAPIALGDSGVSLIVLAATDENPRWVAKRQQAFNEMKRLRNIQASKERIRARAIELYVDAIVIGWVYVDPEGARHPGPLDAHGNAIPFTKESITAWLTNYSDAFTAVEATIYESTNFRGSKIEAVFENVKN